MQLAQPFFECGEAVGIRTPRHRWQLPGLPAIGDETKADLGPSQGHQSEVMLDVGAFGFFGAEKFPAGGQVEEDLPHLDGGSGGRCCCFDFDDLAAVDHDLGGLAGSVFALAGGDDEPAHAGDAGQGFTPEAHGGDGGEVFGAGDLGGGVAFQAEQGVVAAHAPAVVGDANEAAPAGSDFDGDTGGACIQ